MGDAAAGDAWGDTAFAEHAAVLVEVVAAVGEELAGLAPGPAAPAEDRRNRVEQRKQLGDVVAVPAGQGDRERNPVGVDDQTILRARVTTVDRRGPDERPPLSACTWEASTEQRSRLSWPAARSSVRRSSCRAGQTPASVRSRGSWF
jgi:hypothetical protein